MPTILAIDDKKDNLVSVAAILKDMIPDCEVLTALSGPDGIDQTRASLPDVVLLDIKMPGMDGYEVCERLKADPATNPIPVVLLTAARTDVESRVRGLEAGADAFLSKPIDPAELAAQVKVALRIKRVEDTLREEQSRLEERVRERTAELEHAYAQLSRKEKLVRESDEFHRASLDSLSASIAIIDETGRILHVNRAWREFAEENDAPHLADFEGHNYLDVCDAAEGPDAQFAHDFAAAIRDVLAGRRQSFQIEYPCHGPKEKRWFIARVTRFAGAQPRAVIAHENISEQKRAEECLRDSEARYRAVFDNAQDALCVLDADGRFLEANSAATRMYGYEHDEFLRLNVRDLLREDYIPVFEDFRRQISQSGAFRGSTVDRRKDGTEIDVEVTGARFFYHGEQRLLAVIRDVTQWHHMLRELEDHNREMEQILAAFPDAFVFTDTRRRILRVNPAFTRIFGYAPAEVLGKQTKLLYAREEDFEEQGRIRYNPNSPERYDPFEVTYRRRDGEEFPSETIGTTVRDARDNLVGMVGLVRDITERKKAEETLEESRRQLVEAQYVAHMGNFTWKIATGEVTWSPGAYRMLKYDESEAVTFDLVQERIHHPDDLEWVTRWLQEGIASEEDSLSPREYRLICSDGEVIYVRTHARIERDENGEAVRLFGAILDITPQKLAEMESEASRRRLIEAQDIARMGDFSRNLMTGEVDISEGLCRLLKYDKHHRFDSEFIDKHVHHPDDLDGVLRWVKEGADSGQDLLPPHEYRVICKDGEVLYVRSHARIERDENGEAVRIFGAAQDITALKEAELALRESEQRVRRKLDAILTPGADIGELELADVMDVDALDALMEDFCAVTGFANAVLDVHGKILIAKNWQDICRKFHRVHPQTACHCLESDTELTAGSVPGESRLYHCKNRMWDTASPIIVGGRHLGNVYMGQFFFDGEEVDTEAFRAQARRYGFDEEAYMAALARVPRWSREEIDRVMRFYSNLANLLSKLGYSNVRLAKTLAEREQAQAEIRMKSNVLENSLNGFIIVDEAETIVYVNQAFLEIWGYDSKEELIGTSPVCLWTDPAMHDEIIANLKEHGRFNPRYLARRKDGSTFWMSMYTRLDRNEKGETIYFGTCIDITERVVAAQRQELYADILSTLNRSNEWKSLISDLLGRVKEFTRFDGIGVRLTENGDYPYFAVSGLSEEFIEAEGSLCRFDQDGAVVRDADGNIRLHCLCGDVIQGRIDPGKPWFTNGGSFWTNDIAALAERDDAPEFVDIAKSQCLAHGYSSLALIPLRAGNETIGLLQFNVARPGAFTEDLIAFFEQIGVSIGIAFTRKRIQEDLQESESKLREAQRMAQLGHWYWDVNTGDVDWSDEVYRIFNLDPREFTPHIEAIQALSPWPEDHQRDAELIEKAKKSREPGTFEQRFLRPDGSTAHYYSTFQGVYDESGELTAIKGTVQDVTERKLAEEALRESEALLNDTGMIARIAGWTHDLRTRKAVWTEALYDIVGIQSGPPPGPDEHWDYYPEEERKKLETVYNRAIETGEPFDIELRWYTQKRDRLLWCRVIGKAVLEDGECIGLKGTFQDITDRKQAEEAIVESEKKYRLLADNTVDCIWTADLETVFTYVNPAIEHTLGFAPQEWIGTTVADHCDEWNLGIMKGVIDQAMAALPSLDPVTFEAEMLHKDGRSVPLEMIGRVLVDEEGAPVALLGTVRDITERKRAEEALVESEKKYRLLADNTVDCIWTMDLNTVFTYVNPAIEIILGFTPEQWLGTPLAEHSDEPNLGIMKGVIDEALGALPKIKPVTFEAELIHKDGHSVPFEIIGRVLVDDDGKPVGLQGVTRDITERKRAEAALRDSEERYRLTALETGQIVYEYEPDTGHVEWLGAVERITGHSPKEFAEVDVTGWEAMIHPDDRESTMEALHASREACGRYDVVYRLRRKDGDYVHVDEHGIFIPDEEGRAVRMLGSMNDITQRYQDRKELAATKGMLEAAINQSPAGILIADAPDVTIRLVNPAAYEIRGGDRARLAGIPMAQHAEHWRVYRPDGTLCSPEELPLSRAILRGDVTRNLELIIRDENGEDHWVSCNAAPIRDDAGEINAGIVILLDVTERRLNENLVRMNFDTLERLARKLPLKEILQPLSEQVEAVLPGNRSSIELRSSDGRFLHSLLAPHLQEEWIRLIDPIEIGPEAGSCGTAAYRNERVIVEDIASDPLWKSARDDALAFGFAACWSEPIRDDKGEILGTFAMYLEEARGPSDRETRVLENISGLIALVIQSVRREESLRESEQRFYALFENAPLGYQSLDENGHFITVNQTWLDTLGYRRDEVVGSWFGDFLEERYKALFPQRFEKFRRCGRVSGVEFDMRKADGSVATMSFEGRVAHDAAGAFLQTHCILRDVTEQRAAERALRQSEHMLARTESIAAVGSWEWDVATDQTTWSDELYHVFGFNPSRGPLSFDEYAAIYPAEETRRFRDAVEAALADGTPYSLELKMLRGDGEMRTVFSRGFADHDEEGNPVRLYGFVQDITERKQAEEELKAYRDHLQELVDERTEEIAQRSTELEAANAELEAFSYSVSHDLRAPLRRMDGFSRSVYDNYADVVDEQGKHFLQRICANAKQMGDLIDDLLKLSRISRGEMKYERVDLGAVANKISLELKSSEPDRDVDFQIESDVVVRGDAPLLEAALRNLLANAWKFTGKTEHARIEFGSAINAECGAPNAELPDDARVYFVRDNGAGFDMAFADKLFGPFQRLHRVDEFEGSGIGLATVQRIIRRHGGTAWAQGAVGEGAAFYFSLPPTRSKEEQ